MPRHAQGHSSFSVGWAPVSCNHQRAIQPPQHPRSHWDGLVFDPIQYWLPANGIVTYLGDDSLPPDAGLLGFVSGVNDLQ